MGEAWREGLARFYEYYQQNHGRLIKLAPYWQKGLSCIKHKGYRIGLFTGKGKTALSTLYHKPDDRGLRLEPEWVFRRAQDLESWVRELPPVGGVREIS